MKKILFALFFCALGQISMAQTEKKLTPDEEARVKFSVHLINYRQPPVFEKATGQAYYNIVQSAFSQTLSVPAIQDAGLSDTDMKYIREYIGLLEGAKQQPLSWEHLYQLEVQYQEWVDQTQHKVSIYQK